VITVPVYNCAKLENKLILVQMASFRVREEAKEILTEIQRKQDGN